MARILVLEDDPPQQRLIHDVLLDEGHEVCLVSSLDECLAHRAEHQHDLLITDLLIYGGLVPINNIIEGASPVLIISGHAERFVIAEESRVEVLSKPYDISEFAEVVKRMTETPQPLGQAN